MRFRTWPIAAIGLASLLLLVIFSTFTATNKAEEIYTRLDQLNSHQREVETKLRQLRSDVHLSGIFVRDYLLDTEREHAEDYQQRLAEFRRANLATLTELRALLGSENDVRISNLRSQLEEYWQTFDPLIDWTIAEKITLSARFLRREVIPRREAVLAIAEEIEQINNANLAAQSAEVTRQRAAFRAELYTLLGRSVFLGVLVAAIAVFRLRVVERRSEEQKLVAQHAERQLRQLSQQLVATQEEERRKLSRELHDHVGQMLTALRMELGRIDRLGGSRDARVAAPVVECRQLVDEMVRLVRDLALGLRPSMLDDMGLQPTLEWQARDFSRRYGVPVDLHVEGNLDTLSEPHRTCVYRVVQEALTNCIRHARASRVVINVHASSDALTLSVIDDGVGVAPTARHAGLGLRGIEERVRELGGRAVIESALGQGSTLTIELPLMQTESSLARAAG
ncbi:MAG TPA: ATP-binding protein [Vicinamibacterales bacterium]|nr:ATP-binding protein [Vicinamibacterales bacterium]